MRQKPLQATQYTGFPVLVLVKADDESGQPPEIRSTPLTWPGLARWLLLLLLSWARQTGRAVGWELVRLGQDAQALGGRLAGRAAHSRPGERLWLELQMGLILWRSLAPVLARG